MVIGFDGSRAFTDKKTGTENYSYQLLKALSKIDRVNHYIVYLRTQGLTLRGWSDNFEFKLINWPRLWTQGGLAIQTFKDKLDVLFIPAHTLPIIHKPGLKTVVTVHDLGSEYLPAMHQLKQRLYLGFIQRYQLKTASKIIAVSKATKDDLVEKIGLDPKKIEVIYEGYNKNLFKSVRDDILVSTLRYYNLQPKTYYLFVGTVQPRKNLKRVIEAIARLNEKIVIVGTKGWYSDDIYNLPRKLGIEKRVEFLGYAPDDKLAKLYKGAIALVFPSLFEGFGLPILEAQACGCPVIISNISSMPEVAGKGAVYVDPNSVNDIVRGMVRIKNKELRIKLIKQGLENIKRFSWEKCAAQTLKVFENIN